MSVQYGLYRHFKGGYYFVVNLLKPTNGDTFPMVQYVNVLHPEYGYFCRTAAEWDTDVSERKDNVTGQTHRMEKVQSLEVAEKNLTTDQLIRELRERPDSPLQSLDIKGLSSLVSGVDYVVGEPMPETDDVSKGVFTVASFTTKDEAFKHLRLCSSGTRCKVYKRTFIEESQ